MFKIPSSIHPSKILACSILLSIGSSAGIAVAQSTPIPDDAPPQTAPAKDANQQTTPQAAPQTFAQVFAMIEQAEPNRRAGLRSSFLAQAMQVMPVVVIVENPSSYLDAISGWEGQIRYPVLYDDGTDLSRENVARFVRAFEPDEVVRVSKEGLRQLGSSTQERQEAIGSALAAAISDGEPDWEASLNAIKDSGIISPGVVVIDPMDQHWAAGLAIAAGRIQPMIFMKGPQSESRELTPGQAEAINQAIVQGLIRLGRSYKEIGDETDAVTLAFRSGIKIKTGPGDRDRVATTDRIGRNDSSAGGLRWAWCGQFFGSTSATVYQAMCSLFLPIESAFIWDGYPSTGEWDRYDGTKAESVLADAGFETELFDEPRNSLAGFRSRGDSGPVDASLIMMNTKGAAVYYDLPGSAEGIGKPGDLPLLSKPSALHIVHSFSLSLPYNDKTVGGRWLDRGVYLYAGSVDEPFLTGFVPTPLVASRLLGKMHFAGAVHYDDGQAWKVAVIGDPLKAVGPCGSRMESTPEAIAQWAEQVGGEALSQRAKDHLKAGRYSEAMEDFVLVNRDDAVVRLARALIDDKPESIDDHGAKIIIQAAMREGKHELVLDAFERLSMEARNDLQSLDALWFAGRYRVHRFDDRRALALLQSNLRDRQEIFDAEQIAMVLRKDSMSQAIAYLESIRPIVLERERYMLDSALKRVRR